MVTLPSMKKIILLVLALMLVSGLSAQEGVRPELSKKEVRQYNKKLKKLNVALKKKSARLEKLLRRKEADSLNLSNPLNAPAMPDVKLPDSLSNAVSGRLDLKERIPGLDSAGLAANITGRLKEYKDKVPRLDSANLKKEAGSRLREVKNLAPQFKGVDSLASIGGEIDRLKKRLRVGKEMAKSDSKTNGKIEESVLELTDIEYELKDVEALKSRLKNFQLDSAELKKYLGPLSEDVQKIQGQVGEYQSMLDGYKGQLVDWDKTLEKEILKLEEVQGLAEYVQKPPIEPAKGLTDAQKTIDKGYQSTDFVNKLIKERFEKLLEEEGPDALAKRLAVSHEKLAEYKKKYTSLDDITKAPKRPPNPLKGLPFKERLVFGGNLQVNRQKPLTLDAGLEIAYKLSPKAELGVGGAYRIKLEKGARPETVTDLVNLKTFYHHRIWRSLGIQANYELNYALPRTEQAVEGLRKEWRESGLIGLRNDRPFLKKLGGYVTLQYDFLHKATSPNPKWVFRFGFRLK